MFPQGLSCRQLINAGMFSNKTTFCNRMFLQEILPISLVPKHKILHHTKQRNRNIYRKCYIIYIMRFWDHYHIDMLTLLGNKLSYYLSKDIFCNTDISEEKKVHLREVLNYVTSIHSITWFKDVFEITTTTWQHAT